MVDRCVCYNKTFAELKLKSQKSGARSIPELQRLVTFGENCQKCHPYVEMMLKTGETVFAVLDDPDARYN